MKRFLQLCYSGLIALLFSIGMCSTALAFGKGSFVGRFVFSLEFHDTSDTGDVDFNPALGWESGYLKSDGKGHLTGEVVSDYGVPGGAYPGSAPTTTEITGTYTVDASSGQVVINYAPTSDSTHTSTLTGYLSATGKNLSFMRSCVYNPDYMPPCVYVVSEVGIARKE